MCDVQRAPLELWWRAPLEVWGSALSGWGVGGSTGEVLSTFGARGSSVILLGLTLSCCDGLCCRCVEGASLLVPWKGLFLNGRNVYVALLHMRNIGSSGVVARCLSVVLAGSLLS